MTDRALRPLCVIKVGGDAVLDDDDLKIFANNVADVIRDGWCPVVLHGGGPQVTAQMKRLGMTTHKVGGRRVTSPADLRVVISVLCGEVNVRVLAALRAAGVNAFGTSGASGGLITAHKRPPIRVTGGGDALVDFGEVGDVDRVDAALLRGLLHLGVTPVIATLGIDETGRLFNINADTTVVQIARALRADALLLATGVGAVYGDLHDPQSRIARVDAPGARALIDQGVIAGGMIPKIEEALAILEDGVGQIAIVPPKKPGAFRLLLQGSDEVGTRILPAKAASRD